MYIDGNPRTKKAVKELMSQGLTKDMIFQPGLGPPCPLDGVVFVEGPHYPEAHRWYAKLILKGGMVVKIS